MPSDGWPPADDPAPFHGIVVALLLSAIVLLAFGVTWLLFAV